MKTRKRLLRFTKQISTLCMSVLLLLMCAIPVAANDSAPVGAVISESPAPAPATNQCHPGLCRCHAARI